MVWAARAGGTRAAQPESALSELRASTRGERRCGSRPASEPEALGVFSPPQSAAALPRSGRLFGAGAILRTHVMRPTWHFVLPEDIRWLLELTGQRVRRGLAARFRRLEITEDEIAHAKAAFSASLTGGRHLTRSDLSEVLSAAGISPGGQRLPHLPHDCRVGRAHCQRTPSRQPVHLCPSRGAGAEGTCSGPHRCTPVELTRRYFRSHGPPRCVTSYGGLA
jgi:hypothetical protein